MNNERMIQTQILARGVSSPLVLNAMRQVDRSSFILPDNLFEAYSDSPLPIGSGQTISQPFIVAYMTEQLRLSPGMKVLEIGTGSGYQSAILSKCGVELFTVETVRSLAENAKRRLESLGYTGIHFKTGSGYDGWEENAPYDRIMVTCAPETVPHTLIRQLSPESGIMIIPVGYGMQVLKRITRNQSSCREEDLMHVRFVPMR
ncbi:MAG: protein-L-isoaspartate(D-aspartate) O-methyltransferase [Spirochaetota bacterium]